MLSAALNTLLASPTFASWRQGATLDVAEWMASKAGKTPLVILSVAHLDDDERALVLGVAPSPPPNSFKVWLMPTFDKTAPDRTMKGVVCCSAARTWATSCRE